MNSKQQPPISPEHRLKHAVELASSIAKYMFKTSGAGIPAKSQQISTHNLIYLNFEWKLCAL